MLRWLKQLISPGPRPSPDTRSPEELLAAVSAALVDGTAGDDDVRRAWYAALELLSARGGPEAVSRLREPMTAFHRHHPLEVRWSGTGFHVVDRLGLTSDELVRDLEPLALAPWARMLRSLHIVTGGTSFHHGCGVDGVVALLRDPNAPEAIESLSLPPIVLDARGELDRLIPELCDNPRLEGLTHLVFSATLHLAGRHVERLTRAPWARSLRALEFGEQMIDWSVDKGDAERHAALRALGKFESLTHLSMANNFGSTADLAVFLETPFPALTHLELGHGPMDAALLDLLASTRSLPRLQALQLGSGPLGTDPAWDRVVAAGVPLYLHGQRVTADYPHRGPPRP